MSDTQAPEVPAEEQDDRREFEAVEIIDTRSVHSVGSATVGAMVGLGTASYIFNGTSLGAAHYLTQQANESAYCQSAALYEVDVPDCPMVGLEYSLAAVGIGISTVVAVVGSRITANLMGSKRTVISRPVEKPKDPSI